MTLNDLDRRDGRSREFQAMAVILRYLLPISVAKIIWFSAIYDFNSADIPRDD